MSHLTLLLGGARSGKSSYAQELASACGGHVVYIATAEALDTEMEARIGFHRSDRPEDWETLEIPHGIGQALRSRPIRAGVVVLDCLTMLVSNLLVSLSPDENAPDENAVTQAVDSEIKELLAAIHAGQATWIVVSNEVGMGLVPPYPLGRLYRDLLGKANRQVAGAAGEVYLLVAGIPVPIHQFRTR